MNNLPEKKIAALLLGFAYLALTANTALAQIKNFNKNGGQITRFSTVGNAVDAHDGEIGYFDGTYYLYGTSYDCGFQWGKQRRAILRV